METGLLKYLFIYLVASGLSCSARSLQLWYASLLALQHVGSPTRGQTGDSCNGRQIFSHWTTRDVLKHGRCGKRGLPRIEEADTLKHRRRSSPKLKTNNSLPKQSCVVFIIVCAELSGLFLTRGLSCWQGINRKGVNPSLKNLHPLMRGRIFHILIADFIHFKPVFCFHHPCISRIQCCRTLSFTICPSPGLPVTLQSELTQDEAIPRPEGPAGLWLYAVTAATSSKYLTGTDQMCPLTLAPPLPMSEMFRVPPNQQAPSVRGYLS